MAQLIIVRGASGSGKSTFVTNKFKGYSHFEADMFFIKKGIYTFDRTKLKDAHEWCKNETLKSLKSGKNTVVSNTFIKFWEVEPYLNIAKDTNSKVTIYRLNTQFKNTHNVPDDVVQRMRTTIDDIPNEIQIG